MAGRISYGKLREMLRDPEVPEHELRRYLKPVRRRGMAFGPEVVPNPETVAISPEEERFESALRFGNGFCRVRRELAFERRVERGDRSPVLVSEGDSWFQFPFLVEDVIDHLNRDFLVWSIDAAGDTAENMVFRMPEYMAALDRNAGQVKAFLFSAAGNDVIGEDADGVPVLTKLLRPRRANEAPDELIDRGALDETLRFLTRAYRQVIDTIRADTRFARLPIVLHGYDYAIPGAVDDARDPIYAKPDEWLGGPLRERKIDDPKAQRLIVRSLIDALYRMLFELAGNPAETRVFVVDVRGTLPKATDWNDEIHGTDEGFARVAARFRGLLNEVIVDDRAISSANATARRVERAERLAAGAPATIVLDPGHGGRTKVGGSSPNNAAGPRGTLERDLTLALAKLTLTELQERGHHVLMTRDTDRNLGLRDRAQVAAEAEADVFVSLHFNGWTTPNVQGTETFHHTAGSKESMLLARCVQETVRGVTGLRDRGVKSERFGVLDPSRHAPTTAACLLEVSFLTDPAEEDRLEDQAYRLRLAAAVADGAERYLEEVRQRAPLMVASRFEAGREVAELEDATTLDAAVDSATLVGPGLTARVPARRPEFARKPAGAGHRAPSPALQAFADPGRFESAWRNRRRERAGIERPSRLERAIGRDDSLPYLFLERGAAVGRAVCKIVTGPPFEWFGTGFLVAPNVLLTNNHVLDSIECARTATALFAYEIEPSGSLSPVKAYKIDPEKLFITSPAEGGLDFTFVHLEGDAHEHFSCITMQRAAFSIAPNERANIIHHPDGQPKRVSLQDNKILDFDPVMLHYASDTEAGSSGSPVLDNTWRLIALHHAWNDLPADVVSPDGSGARYINEGIKLAAIAVELETRLRDPSEQAAARRVLACFEGADSITGYFGALGRSGGDKDERYERVVQAYEGAAQDIDVAFWNVEWFNRRYRDRVGDVARIVADLNLDIWALAETSPEATAALVEELKNEFGHEFRFAASEPDAPSGRQTTTVMWNPRTVEGVRLDWPADIDALLRSDSRDLDETRFEAVEGKVFNRYPGLFRFKVLGRSTDEAAFDFNLVPLHLKAMAEGARRRRLASKLLAVAVRTMIEREGADADWLIGGDVNAELATGQFDTLTDSGFLALSAEDEAEGAISYLGGPRSLIDTIFLSPSLTAKHGAEDFFVYAQDETKPDFVQKVSDHRPVLVRLSLHDDRPPARKPKRRRKGARSGHRSTDRDVRELVGGEPITNGALVDALAQMLSSDPEEFVRVLQAAIAEKAR